MGNISLESVFKLSLVMNMIDNLTGPMAGVSTSVSGSVSKLQSMNQSLGNLTKTGMVMQEVGSQIVGAVLEPVQATFATRRALGELASLGVRDLGAVEGAAKSFSDQWAGTTKADFISAAYDIKSGIASLSDQGVADMTNLSALTAKATKSTAAEMTSLFATGYGIYKDYYSDLSDMEFGSMFSAGISKSVQQFKTTGSGMAQAIQSLGASATTAQVPLEEQLSVLGMLQATMGGAEAGTKYKAFLRSAVKGGEELGLKFMDTNNQLLSMPEILDQLHGKFGETMDAAEKMDLQKAFGDTESVALIDLMYNKVGDLQGNIVGMYDSLGSGVDLTTKMASAINETEPEKYTRLQQQIQNVKESIGNDLLPTINDMLGKGEEVLTKTAAWISSNQQLVQIIMLVIGAIGGFLIVGGTMITVVGGIGLIFTKTAGLVRGFIGVIGKLPGLLDTVHIKALYAGDGLKKGFSMVKTWGTSAVSGIKSVAVQIASMAKTAAVTGVTALKSMALGLIGMAKQAVITAATALPGLIASVWSFTAALLANPVTWIVIGIVALIAAIILLWQNWDQVVAWLQNAWAGFVNGIKAGFDWIMNLFSGMPEWLKIALAVFLPFIGIPLLIIENWDSIVAFFVNLWGNVTNAFVTGINNIKNFFTGIPEWFRESGAKIITTLTDGIKSAAMKPVEAVTGIFQKVRNLLPFSDAKDGPLSTLTLSGKRTMTTYAEGVSLAQGAPGDAVEKGLSGAESAFRREPVKKVRFGRTENSQDEESSTGGNPSGGKITIIKKLVLTVDLKNIKRLPDLFALIDELEESANGDEDNMDYDPDAIPELA